jgi:hypothetical protein
MNKKQLYQQAFAILDRIDELLLSVRKKHEQHVAPKKAA